MMAPLGRKSYQCSAGHITVGHMIAKPVYKIFIDQTYWPLSVF
jgi:hypothetical protein